MFYSYKHYGETRLTDALERELLLEAEQSYSEPSFPAVKAAIATLRRWLTSRSTTASSYWVSFHKHAA